MSEAAIRARVCGPFLAFRVDGPGRATVVDHGFRLRGVLSLRLCSDCVIVGGPNAKKAAREVLNEPGELARKAYTAATIENCIMALALGEGLTFEPERRHADDESDEEGPF